MIQMTVTEARRMVREYRLHPERFTDTDAHSVEIAHDAIRRRRMERDLNRLFWRDLSVQLPYQYGDSHIWYSQNGQVASPGSFWIGQWKAATRERWEVQFRENLASHDWDSGITRTKEEIEALVDREREHEFGGW